MIGCDRANLLKAAAVIIAVSIAGTVFPAGAMQPSTATQILADAQLVFYRNFVGGEWTFDGFLDAHGNVNAPNLVNGYIFPNGKGLFHVPDLSFGECMALATKSFVELFVAYIPGVGVGPPAGAQQTTGGCTDPTGDVPEPGSPSDLVACSTPNLGSRSFGYNNMNPIQAGLLRSSGATCGVCVQGPGWYPCQAGIIGCSNPPAPGSCAPRHY